MKRTKRERFKTVLLVILILLSVVQIGIHWGQQSQGLPFDFLLAIFSGQAPNGHVDVDAIKDKYFLPEHVIVAINPFTQWFLTKENIYYQTIWNDVRDYYLPQVFNGKPSEVLSKKAWEARLKEACTKIDFYVSYPKSMLSWFTDSNASKQGFTGIKSIAIFPQEDVNETVNTVYVYDETSAYKYTVDIREKMQPKAFYRKLPDMLRESGYMSMSAIGEVFPDIAANPDLPIYVNENTSQSFRTISAKIPDAIFLDPESDMLGSIQESILLDQKDSLTAYHARNNNTAVFSDLENVYRLDSDGVLTYQYLPQVKAEPGDAKSSFVNAISFIELRKNLAGEAEIVMTGLERDPKDPNSYIFTFNYMFESNRIFISDIKEAKDMLVPAITIKASPQRVLECRWIIREIASVDETKEYKTSFPELIDRIYSNNPALYLGLFDEDALLEIHMGYFFDARVRTEDTLAPAWLIKTKTGYYKTLLPEKGGN
jgi:hypothetical protein